MLVLWFTNLFDYQQHCPVHNWPLESQSVPEYTLITQNHPLIIVVLTTKALGYRLLCYWSCQDSLDVRRLSLVNCWPITCWYLCEDSYIYTVIDKFENDVILWTIFFILTFQNIHSYSQILIVLCGHFFLSIIWFTFNGCSLGGMQPCIMDSMDRNSYICSMQIGPKPITLTSNILNHCTWKEWLEDYIYKIICIYVFFLI